MSPRKKSLCCLSLIFATFSVAVSNLYDILFDSERNN